MDLEQVVYAVLAIDVLQSKKAPFGICIPDSARSAS